MCQSVYLYLVENILHWMDFYLFPRPPSLQANHIYLVTAGNGTAKVGNCFQGTGLQVPVPAIQIKVRLVHQSVSAPETFNFSSVKTEGGSTDGILYWTQSVKTNFGGGLQIRSLLIHKSIMRFPFFLISFPLLASNIYAVTIGPSAEIFILNKFLQPDGFNRSWVHSYNLHLHV